jgi:hypothetical protein
MDEGETIKDQPGNPEQSRGSDMDWRRPLLAFASCLGVAAVVLALSLLD